jgi:forkhead box protein K
VRVLTLVIDIEDVELVANANALAAYMDIRTRSVSPVQVKLEQTPLPQNKISAYYSLVFPHFTFYIQTLSVTIGRRCAPNPNAATSSTAEPVVVDVDLGALKSVSRLHAKIEFDQDEDRFVLVVIGRNGAWVDGVWSGAGTRASLGERSTSS